MKQRVYMLVASLLVLLPGTVTADDHKHALQLYRQGEIVSLETVLEKLPDARPGRIIEVELEREQGRYLYEIERLESGGIVREYVFDAGSGELLESKIED